MTAPTLTHTQTDRTARLRRRGRAPRITGMACRNCGLAQPLGARLRLSGLFRAAGGDVRLRRRRRRP